MSTFEIIRGEALKPCPWCGNMPVLCVREKLCDEDNEPFFKYSVACDGPSCHIKPHTPYWKHKYEAIYDWNKRSAG